MSTFTGQPTKQNEEDNAAPNPDFHMQACPVSLRNQLFRVCIYVICRLLH